MTGSQGLKGEKGDQGNDGITVSLYTYNTEFLVFTLSLPSTNY